MALEDLTDELRVSSETPESIKARLLADTNAGVDPADPAYADTLPGSFWDDLEGAACLEWDRLYDRLDTVAAAAIPATSWGAHLDGWAESLGTERADAAYAGGQVQFTGPNGTVIPTGARVSTSQTSIDDDPVEFSVVTGATIGVSGTVTVDVVAVLAGSEGNVPAGTVTVIDTQTGAAAVNNAFAMTGGADVETDEALSRRLLRRLAAPAGGGNADQYVNWGLEYPGVGFVTAQPNVPTVGHVTVLITDVNNDPMPTHAVDGLQARLDPSGSAAQGAGLAPPGATVHVATPTPLAITIAADVSLEPGFSLDGTGGTQAVRQKIKDALSLYVDNLPVGGDVLRNKVIGALVSVVGVADVDETTLTLNGSTSADVAVSATQVASLTTATIT